MSDPTQSYSIDDMKVGQIVERSLYDHDERLLVNVGVTITAAIIDGLRRRGITQLYLRGDGPSASIEKSSGNAARGARPARPTARRGPPPASSDAAVGTDDEQAVFEELSSNYSAKKIRRLAAQFSAGTKAVEHLHRTIGRSVIKNLRRVGAPVDDYVRELVDDADPVVAAALSFEADMTLSRRSVRFSVLSLAMANRMNLEPTSVAWIGQAALVHDWSLLETPPETRFPSADSSEEEIRHYRGHPLRSVTLLNMIAEVPDAIKLYVGQVHERLDGSGFPMGLNKDNLDIASSVLAVADAYLSMTHPINGGPRVVPCDAVNELVTAAAKGCQSPLAVRALLESVTLYPIGSIVELSDASRARVIHSNGRDYGYPIVESMVDASRIINLKESDVFVTRPILSKRHNEVRLADIQSAG